MPFLGRGAVTVSRTQILKEHILIKRKKELQKYGENYVISLIICALHIQLLR
jgi:hypothetical protein